MKIDKLLIALLCLGIAIAIPFFYTDLVRNTVLYLPIGWVVSSILIRLIVIVFFILFLKNTFQAFEQTRKIKNWVTVIIALVPGFFLSFAISPIYDIDYGMFDDGLKLPSRQEVVTATENHYQASEGHEIMAFLDVGCGHCRLACQKLSINKEAGQTIPINLFFAGEKADIDHFIDENNGNNLDYHILQTEDSFVHLAGFEFPSIYLIKPNGETAYHWVGEKMNYSALDYLLDLEQ